MYIDWYIFFMKIIFVFLTISYAAFKLCNYKSYTKKQYILNFINIIICTILYTRLRYDFENIHSYFLTLILFDLNFVIVNKLYGYNVFLLLLISNAISYIVLFIATIINFIFLMIFSINIENYNLFEYIIIGILQLIIVYLFFKIKRFKDGFSFLKSNNKDHSKIINTIISIIIILISSIIGKESNDAMIDTICFVLISIGGIVMIIWIKKEITNYYKKKMKDRTVEMLKEQIKEKEETIEKLKKELAQALKINHKYNHRLSSMEKAVNKLGNNINFNEEIAEEYGDISDALKELSKEYKEELYNLAETKELSKTNIFSIDKILEYMKTEANKDNIEFKLEIKSDVKYMVDNLISKSKMETLLGDHIKDAIIAINNSNNKNKKIKVIFEQENDIYEIKIYDTGIEFEIDTLLKLGLEPITTHKETGGSGIGFITTFETLNECKASLVIEEKQEMLENEYTKAIIIKFDGKNQYKIKSYRKNEIEKKNTDNKNKIILENN